MWVTPARDTLLSVLLPSSSQLFCDVCCTATHRVLGSRFTLRMVACRVHFRDEAQRGEGDVARGCVPGDVTLP